MAENRGGNSSAWCLAPQTPQKHRNMHSPHQTTSRHFRWGCPVAGVGVRGWGEVVGFLAPGELVQGPLSFLSFSSWPISKVGIAPKYWNCPLTALPCLCATSGPGPSIPSENAERASTVLGLPLIPLDVGVPSPLLSISLSSGEGSRHHAVLRQS